MLDAFEESLSSFIEKMGEKSVLRDACQYALESGGKRLRPLLVLMIADALDRGCNVTPSAIGVECFHTSSLIADDLPCMDNDDLRRGKPSLHKVFGESTALLASYTLIASGYGCIYENAHLLRQKERFQDSADARAVLCLEGATRCAGLKGATQGQFLDLSPPDRTLATILDVIVKKTATLFEIAFLFGWLFGGGDLSLIPLLRKCAGHLGVAFQIADDLEDAEQDAFHETSLNIGHILGKKNAFSLFLKETELFKESLIELNLWSKSFQDLHQQILEKTAPQKRGLLKEFKRLLPF